MNALRSYRTYLATDIIKDEPIMSWEEDYSEKYHVHSLDTEFNTLVTIHDRPTTEQVNSSTENFKKSANFKSLFDVYGVISEVEGNKIYAHIYEHNGDYLQDIEFLKSEFDESDQHLVEQNGVFYWKVGSKIIGGTSRECSEFRMRRLVTHSFPIQKARIAALKSKYIEVLCSK
ncbi:hypothetical protein [Shewanella algae]|uniref:hypothetical protein n=1 Tax=Shewanella algae TaxID=38313 RepID=UPI002657C8F5|nr:hypothetical protein [Shewanella algae]WKC42244.1 hypothetical protein QYM03_01850 [Shewanella algae]